MSDEPKISDELKEHLLSTQSAGVRTRALLIALIVACVVGFIGFLNSWYYGWTSQRARKVAAEIDYAARKLELSDVLGRPAIVGANPKMRDDNKEQGKAAQAPYDHRRKAAEDLSSALINEYAQNGFQNKLAFFGAVIDVYDFGLIGGIGFISILLLLFYSINTETTAVRLAFFNAYKTRTVQRDTLKIFYAILATRQVLTIPKTTAITEQSEPDLNDRLSENYWYFGWLRRFPKSILALPGLMYMGVVIYDFFTLEYGLYISQEHTIQLVVYSEVFLFVIWFLIAQCWRSLNHIEKIWDYWHEMIKSGESVSLQEPLSPAHILAACLAVIFSVASVIINVFTPSDFWYLAAGCTCLAVGLWMAGIALTWDWPFWRWHQWSLWHWMLVRFRALWHWMLALLSLLWYWILVRLSMLWHWMLALPARWKSRKSNKNSVTKSRNSDTHVVPRSAGRATGVERKSP